MGEGQGRLLHLVGPNTQRPINLPDDCVLGLAGDHQRHNAALAVALCRAVMQQHPPAQTVVEKEPVLKALKTASWPGRCQTVIAKKSKTRHTVTVRLDGAHTLHSISAGFHWFQEVAFSPSEK